jgi:tetratricopeptide (TPR) repeat protein
VLESQPNNVGAMRNLMLLYRDNNQPAEGIPWVEKAISLTPTERPDELAPLYEVAGQLYQAVGDLEKAIAALEQLRQLVPNDVNTLRNLSNLYNVQQNDAKVLEMAQALIALEPTSFEHPLSAARMHFPMPTRH